MTPDTGTGTANGAVTVKAMKMPEAVGGVLTLTPTQIFWKPSRFSLIRNFSEHIAMDFDLGTTSCAMDSRRPSMSEIRWSFFGPIGIFEALTSRRPLIVIGAFNWLLLLTTGAFRRTVAISGAHPPFYFSMAHADRWLVDFDSKKSARLAQLAERQDAAIAARAMAIGPADLRVAVLSGVNVRDASHEVIGSLAAGDEVAVVNEDRDSYLVSLPDGRTGYISKMAAVKVASTPPPQ